MVSKTIPAMLCAVLLIYGPMAEAARGSTILGQVMVKGNAQVNGIATPSGATVFSGDRVGTETNTIAELLLNGGSKVMLPESSIVVLRNDADQVIVDLKQGALAALSKSSSPAFIDVNGVRIKPAAEVGAVVEVAVHGNSLKVAARRGSAIVETADKAIEVKEGKELDATLAPPPPQGPAGPGPHPSMRSSLATWELITAAGAGLTGLVLGIVAVSRANPANCKVASPSGTITCP